MRKRVFALALVISLLNMVYVVPVAAGSDESKEAKREAKMKEKLAKLGTGPKARIEVKLRNKNQIKGYVSDKADDHFVVTEEKTGNVTTVMYAEIDKINSEPRIKPPIERGSSPGRILKNAVIGLGLVLTGVMVVCVVSKRCQE